MPINTVNVLYNSKLSTTTTNEKVGCIGQKGGDITANRKLAGHNRRFLGQNEENGYPPLVTWWL